MGFLAALGSGGGGGGGNPNFRVGQDDFNLPPGMADDFSSFFSQYGPIIIGLACLGLVIGIIFWLLRLTAQAGLISAVARIDAGEKVSFGEAFSAGTGKLGRMIGINVIMYGPFTLLGFITGAIILATAGTAIAAELSGTGTGDIEALVGAMGIFALCFGCLACLMVPLMIVVTAIYPFAQRGAVLGDLGVTSSISHGWNIVKTNLSDVILLIILFFILSIVFGIIAAVVLIPLAILGMGPAIISMIAKDAIEILDVFLIVGGGICVGLVAAAVNSIIVAFRSTAVTLAYQEFANKTA